MQLNTTVKAVLSVLPVLIFTVSCSKKPSTEEEALVKTPEVEMQSEVPLEESLYADNQEQQIEALRTNNIIKFNFDKYDILPEFAQILDAHAILLRDNPGYKVLIEGHADERGTPEYNIALGERRANAVAMYLQGNGVSQNQITVVSYGQERPVDLGHGPVAHAKNRRAVLVY